LHKIANWLKGFDQVVTKHLRGLRPKNVVGMRIEIFAYGDRVHAYAIVHHYYKTRDRFQLKLYAKADAKRCTKGGDAATRLCRASEKATLPRFGYWH
jgi:hypothetical protein